MSLTTWSENVARFLMVFGLLAVVTMFAVGLVKADLVGDVYEQQATFQDPSNPASTTDPAVRADWQDAQTIQAWERTFQFLGLGSILSAIILTFAITIYRGLKLLRTVFPQFWRIQLARWTGKDQQVTKRLEDTVPLPFGGGT